VAFVPALFRLINSRHTHATLLTEVGESIKTAQALLGHSDLGTTLNTYAHVIPDSQRRAVERVAEVLFSNLRKMRKAGKPTDCNSRTLNLLVGPLGFEPRTNGL
jgi:hypothetical protein